MMLVLARYRLGAAPWLLWPGVAVIASAGRCSSTLSRRLIWVRAHPFDPNGIET
jgi:hypothetical protein